MMPPKSTFKVCPVSVHAADAQQIFIGLQKKVAALLQHRQGELLALSVAEFPYAESLYVSWVLLWAILPHLE
jgi:hypothetical protein